MTAIQTMGKWTSHISMTEHPNRAYPRACGGTGGPIAWAVNADFGRDTFGDARLTWTRGLATCTAKYAWGITALAGVPDNLVERE